MSQNNTINTTAIQQFINQVKAADLGNQREIKMNIVDAKNLSYTLALTMTRLAGNYEGLIQQNQTNDAVITVQMDGGTWDEK